MRTKFLPGERMRYFQKQKFMELDSILRYFILLLFLKMGFLAGGCDFNMNQPLMAQSNVVLGTSGEWFTINGTPTFLLGVSYFDGRNYRESDLVTLSAKGFNLIRVWLDWREDSYLDENGNWRSGAEQDLLRLVDFAHNQGLIVDIAILDKDAAFGNNKSDRDLAVRNVASLLKNKRNVLFDLANEHDTSGFLLQFTHSDAADLNALVKRIDPDRLVTISSTGCHLICTDVNNVETGNIKAEIDEVNVDVLTPHFLRGSDWAVKTGPRLAAIKNYLQSTNRNIPIYLQEENRRNDNTGPTKDEFFEAAENAVNLGAAAWIFHTAAGFTLKGSTFFDNLDPTERLVVDELGSRILGSSADRMPPTSPRNVKIVIGRN